MSVGFLAKLLLRNGCDCSGATKAPPPSELNDDEDESGRHWPLNADVPGRMLDIELTTPVDGCNCAGSINEDDDDEEPIDDGCCAPVCCKELSPSKTGALVVARWLFATTRLVVVVVEGVAIDMGTVDAVLERVSSIVVGRLGSNCCKDDECCSLLLPRPKELPALSSGGGDGGGGAISGAKVPLLLPLLLLPVAASTCC